MKAGARGPQFAATCERCMSHSENAARSSFLTTGSTVVEDHVPWMPQRYEP